MGPNSFRNLTYAAVLLVVGSLVYLIYKSSKNKNKLNPATEMASSGLSTYGDTSATLAGATLTPDLSTTSQDGQLVSGAIGATAAASAAATSPSTYNSKSKSSDEVKEITAEEPGSLSSTGPSDIASSEKKVNVKSGGSGSHPEKMSIASKGIKAKAKFDAGSTKGDFMVVAGAFASKDNAASLVTKMKSMGFAKAEAVKMENSANTYAIAGYYEFKGGAEAAVRTLKANKVESLVKKRTGEIYHAAPAPVVAPKSPVKPAVKPAQATNKPI
jgi:cell division septation protein DedD